MRRERDEARRRCERERREPGERVTRQQRQGGEEGTCSEQWRGNGDRRRLDEAEEEEADLEKAGEIVEESWERGSGTWTARRCGRREQEGVICWCSVNGIIRS